MECPLPFRGLPSLIFPDGIGIPTAIFRGAKHCPHRPDWASAVTESLAPQDWGCGCPTPQGKLEASLPRLPSTQKGVNGLIKSRAPRTNALGGLTPQGD